MHPAYVYKVNRAWRCTREWPHSGPCALVPRWWNVIGRLRYWRFTR